MKKYYKSFCCLICFVIMLLLNNKVYAADDSTYLLYNGKYIEVIDSNPIRTDKDNGWYVDTFNNWYYVFNKCNSRTFEIIDKNTYLFNSNGKYIETNSDEYNNYINKLNNIYQSKKNKSNLVIDSFKNQYDAYILLYNYNFYYLFSEPDLFYTGLDVIYNQQNNSWDVIIKNNDITLENEFLKIRNSLKGVGIDGFSILNDEEKCKQIHDLILNTFHPDYEMKNHSGMAGSFLNENKFVCIGYADTFYRLTRYCGLTSEIITGESYGTAHAWNRVKIKGVWKYVDCTYDATDKEARNSKDSYDWFLKSKNYFDLTHFQF